MEYVEEDFKLVALFTRAWIEIATEIADMMIGGVALFTRAWIEIYDIED